MKNDLSGQGFARSENSIDNISDIKFEGFKVRIVNIVCEHWFVVKDIFLVLEITDHKAPLHQLGNYGKGGYSILTLLVIARDSQPFGSIPRRFNSSRASSLNQLLSVILSESAAAFSCSRSSGWMRIWNAGDWPPDFGVRSFTLDIVHTFSFNGFNKVCTLYHEITLKQTPPNGITSTERGLTTNATTLARQL